MEIPLSTIPTGRPERRRTIARLEPRWFPGSSASRPPRPARSASWASRVLSSSATRRRSKCVASRTQKARARACERERERERGREREREKRGHERTAVELTVSHQACRQPPLLPTPPLHKKHLNSSNSSAERSPTSSRQEKKTPPASASRPSSAKNLCSRPSTPSSSTSSSSACAPRCSRSWTRPRRT